MKYTLDCIIRGTAGKLRNLVISIQSGVTHSIHLKYCTQFWSSSTWKTWQNWTKSNEGPLQWGLGVVSLQKDNERADLVHPGARTVLGTANRCSPTWIGNGEDGARPCTEGQDGTTKTGKELNWGRCSLPIRIKLLSMTLSPWHRLPRVIVHSLCVLGSK